MRHGRAQDHQIEMEREAAERDEFLSRELSGLDLLAIFVSEVEVAEQPVVIAVGVDLRGVEQSLGVWHGSTSDPGLCRAVLVNLVDRGLDPDVRRLVVINGAAGIRSAVRRVFGRTTPIQRSRAHKRQEILEHIPESEHATFAEKLDQAWSEPDFKVGMDRLRALAKELREADLGGSHSILRGLLETFTVARLGLPPSLIDTFSTTADLEWAVVTAASLHGAAGGPTGQGALHQAGAALIDVQRRSPPVRGYRDLHLLAHALDPRRKLPSPEVDLPDHDRSEASGVASSERTVFADAALDITALVTTVALLVAVAFDFQGVARELLALAFVSFVPGWAVVGRIPMGGGSRRIVLAVPLSLSLCAGAATAMAWVQAWRPVLLLFALALGSAVLITWSLTGPLRDAIAASKWPAPHLRRPALGRALRERRPRLTRPSPRELLPGAAARRLSRPGWAVGLRRARQLAHVGDTVAIAASRIPQPEVPKPRVPRRRPSWYSEELRVWLLAAVIQLFWLVPATSLVVLFAIHPITAAGSLGLGMLAGVLLGVWRQRFLTIAALAAALLGGLVAIVWQSLYGGDFSAVIQASFQVALDVWAPATLGAALGVPTLAITKHLRREYAPDRGGRRTSGPRDLSRGRRSKPVGGDESRVSASSRGEPSNGSESSVRRPSPRVGHSGAREEGEGVSDG